MYGNISTNNTISKRLATASSVYGLAKGGGLKIQRRGGDLILCHSATVFGGVMWQ